MPSLSQKHRPKNFHQITGQAAITETLRKEVATGTLGHAYLFSGPRGVGKTTAARVFAKALNCGSPNDGEPCNECANCVSANEGKCLDIIELDAATHTGVDTVRESIIEHVRVSPMGGKRKIYILDEVHMFSSSSWNALLKTLEEPPAYAFFILATTEWHKVPATIVSRCQRFEFKRIEATQLAERLAQIAKDEDWKVDQEVIDLIISRSDGCVRDAETLLNQLGSLADGKIDLEIASLVIPPSHLPLAEGLLKLWASRDHQASLKEAQRLFEEGIPILPLFDDLLTLIRQDLVKGDSAFLPGELNDMALLLMERRRDIKAGVDPLFALQLAGTVVANGLLKNSTHHVSSGEAGPGSAGRNTQLSDPPAAPKEILPRQPADQDDQPTNPLPALYSSTPLPSTSLSLDTVRSKWQSVIRAVEEKNHSLPFVLKISRPEAVEGQKVIIRFQYPFHRDKIISDVKHRRIVEEALSQVMGSACSIDGIVGEDLSRKESRSQDMVSNILNAFGGSIIE